MRRLVAPALVCILLFGFGISCEKMASKPAGDDVTVPLGDLPSSYGHLVSVSSIPEYPGWFQLWFSDDAGTIRIVRVHMVNNLMYKQVNTINRIAGV
jgi:hypothetical protein